MDLFGFFKKKQKPEVKKSPKVGRKKKGRPDATAKLRMWQDRLALSDNYWSPLVEKMDQRERILDGDRKLKPLVPGHAPTGKEETSHVYNIVFENIETQVSTNIPQPKVTPIRKKDEHLAQIIERFIRNEMDRLPFVTINDMAERTVPTQGGVLYWGEWDANKRTHETVGEIGISTIHPKQLAPQPGIYTGINDMDWFILKVPTTRDVVRRKYGVDLIDEGESEPQMRSVDAGNTVKDALTLYVGYERNDEGKINKYCWVNDKELEDLEDYQARRVPVCARCGRTRPLSGQIIRHHVTTDQPQDAGPDLDRMGAGIMMAQRLADEYMLGEAPEDPLHLDMRTVEEEYTGGGCPWCGCTEFVDQQMEFEEVILPIRTQEGMEIPGGTIAFDEFGLPVIKPTKIPFYKPDIYPVVLQKSVSKFGQLLGTSDVDIIADQQNTLNRLNQKIINRIMQAGSAVTLPKNARIEVSPEDGKVIYVDDQAEKMLIDVLTFTGDLSFEMAARSQVYEESRQQLGVTDSFQGRKDPTATSGKAKEYSAAMAAGRLESKRVMKNAAYAQLFEMMFKFWLAYADEPRPISHINPQGDTVYEEFNRYDFLEKDADGQYYWNDMFLFSVDSTAPLERNREAMWQEARMNLQTGAYGNPQSTETLILFWTKMEELHYPGAANTKKFLEDRAKREKAAQLQQLLNQPPGGIPGQAQGPTAFGGQPNL